MHQTIGEKLVYNVTTTIRQGKNPINFKGKCISLSRFY